MAGFHDGAAERDGQMRLADARRTEDQHVFRLREKSAGRELAHQPLIDGRLEFEIEVVQRLDGRKVGDLEGHGDARALLGVHFLAQDPVEEIEVRRLGPGRVTRTASSRSAT